MYRSASCTMLWSKPKFSTTAFRNMFTLVYSPIGRISESFQSCRYVSLMAWLGLLHACVTPPPRSYSTRIRVSSMRVGRSNKEAKDCSLQHLSLERLLRSDEWGLLAQQLLTGLYYTCMSFLGVVWLNVVASFHLKSLPWRKVYLTLHLF